jgi:hypothetical protein
MKAKVERPFLFGPIEFEGLNGDGDFDFESEKDNVIKVL